MLKSYSFSKETLDLKYRYEIVTLVQDLRYYFASIYGFRCSEAMQKTISHALKNYDPDKGSVEHYIRSISKNILKERNKDFATEYVEMLQSKDNTCRYIAEDFQETLKDSADFSDELLSSMHLSMVKNTEVETFALSFMEEFLSLCEILKSGDITGGHFSASFKKCCLSLSRKFGNFYSCCLSLYERVGEEMYTFLENINIDKDWVVLDSFSISSNLNNNYRLKAGGTVSLHPDTDNWVAPKAPKKYNYLYRVDFTETFELFCDMIDSEDSNAIKFVIGDNYVFNMLGCNWSIVNADLFDMYELVREEIITNLLRLTKGRLVGVDYGSCYLYTTDSYCTIEKLVRNTPIRFTFEDITKRSGLVTC